MEPNTAPASEPVQANTSELQPGGAPVDGVVIDENAQTEAAAAQAAAAAEAEVAKANANRERGQRRYSDLTRERNAALEEAAYWRGVAEAKAQGQQPPAQPQGQPAQANALPNGAPNPDAYPAGEFDGQYIRDLARFEAKNILAEERQHEAQAREFETGRERFSNAISLAEGEGFEDGARTLAQIARADRSTVDIITAAENPHWIGQHFAVNPQDLQYAMRLPPAQRAMFIGKLDARFSAYIAATPAPAPVKAPASQPAPVSQQPTPTPQLGGRGVSHFNPETASYEEYRAAREAGRFQ